MYSKSLIARLGAFCVAAAMFCASPAFANVELDIQKNNKTVTAANTLTWNHTCSGGNRILIVSVVHNNKGGANVLSVTYGGVGMTLLTTVVSGSGGSGDATLTVWGRVNPTGNMNLPVVVTLAGGLTRMMAGGSISYFNAEQTLPTIGNGRVTSARNTGGLGVNDPSVSVNSMIVGDIAMDALGVANTPVIAAVDPSQTQAFNIRTTDTPAADQILAATSFETGAASISMDWTLDQAAFDWAIAGVRIAAAPPSLNSAANQVFVVGDNPTAAAVITVQDNGATTDATTDVRLKIPATFNMTWDTTVLSYSAGGTASLKVNPGAVGYEDGGRTAVIDVITDLETFDTLIISDLKFANFSGGSALDNLELEVKNDGTTSSTDGSTIEIRAPTIAYTDPTTAFLSGSAASPAGGVTSIVITDNASQALIVANDAGGDIRIRIPNSLRMTWDTTVTMPTLVTSGAGTVNPIVTYENNNKTVRVDVTGDFGISETLTITGLRFANFTAKSGPAKLALDVRNNAGTAAQTVANLRIRGAVMTSAADQEFALMDTSDAVMSPITITEDTVGTITAANDIRVRIPNGFNMEWDFSLATPPSLIIGGNASALAKVNAALVTYSPDWKVMIIDVTVNFVGGEILTISAGEYTAFNGQTSLDNLELVTDGSNSGNVSAFDAKTIVIAGAQISSAADKSFRTGVALAPPAVNATTITITESAFASTITPANDIRIRIPDGVDMEWDQTVTMPVFGGVPGTVTAKINTTVTYPDARTLLIDVTAPFATSDKLTIAGLRFTNFGASTEDFLELDTLDDITKVGATDPKYVRVVAPTISSDGDQLFQVGAASSLASNMTVTEDANEQTITMANEIRIRIPALVDMVWNTDIDTMAEGVSLTLTGSGAVAFPITFEDAGKVAVINVTTSFGLGDVLEIQGMQFRTFDSSTAVPDNLELVVTGAFGNPANAEDDKTKTIAGVNDAPSFTTGGNFEALAGTGMNTLAGWVEGIGPGGAESGQTVSFMVSNDNPGLFTSPPAIASVGPGAYPDQDITFILNGMNFGVANITVTAMDNGGTANGGVDTSASQTYKITVIEAITQVVATDQYAATTLSKTGAGATPAWNLSFNITAVANRALVVSIASHDTGKTHPISYVRLNDNPAFAFTLVGSVHVDDDAETLLNTMWVLADPPVGMHELVIQVGGTGNIPGLSAGAIYLTGANGNALVLGGAGGFTGQSITPTATFSPISVDQVVIDSLAVIRSPFNNGPAGMGVTVAPTGMSQTERWDINDTSSATFQDHVLSAGSTRINSRGTITNSWSINTTTARSWSILAGILPSAGSVRLSSAANQVFDIGDPSTLAQQITVTESAGTPQITAASNVIIRIPDGVDAVWDTSVGLVGPGALDFTGSTYGGAVTGLVYSVDMKSVTLQIDANFAAEEKLEIANLKMTSFNSASGPDSLELVTTGGDTDPAITEDDKTKTVVQPLTISSAADKDFGLNDNATPNSVITITDHADTAEILMGATICIDIPVGVDMTWDPTDTTVVLGGPAFMKVSGPPVYSNGNKRMCLMVTADFLPGEVLTISGLKFDNFNSVSGPANLTLDVDGDGFVAVDATDDKTKAIGEPTLASSGNQTFLVNDAITLANQIVITEEANVITLTDADEIRIQIPAGLDMEWDTSNTSPTLSGTFITNGGGVDSVSYPDNKTMLISINRNFAAGETLIVNNATFANFGAVTGMPSGPDNLELIASGVGGAVASTVPQTKTVLQPTIETTTMVNQSYIVKSTDQVVHQILITDDLIAGAIIANDANGDIRIKIPGTLDMTFDTTRTDPGLGLVFDTSGLTSGAILTTVSYEDGGKTLVINVTSDFAAGDNFTITGLEFENLNSGGVADSLELEVRNNGVTQSEDPFTKQIQAPTISSALNQNIPVNSGPVVAEVITITDVIGTPLIKMGNLYVRVPATLDMTWDPSVTMITTGGTAVPGKVANPVMVTYPVAGGNRVACIPVTADFASGDTLTLAGLMLQGLGVGGTFDTVTGPDNLELIIDGDPLGTAVAEDDKFKRTSAAIITSAADQFFLAGTGITPISPITIIEHPTAMTVTMANGIVIDIPAGLDINWDTADLTATFGGTFIGNGGSIAAIVAGSYTMGGKRLTLIPSRDFAPGETLTISDLGFNVGATPSAPDKLELSVDGGMTVADEDDKNKAVGAPTLSSASGSEFNVGDPPTILPTINIIESAGPTITVANDIMIKLPASFNGEFDTAKLTPTFGGTAGGKVAGVSYPNPTTMIVNVTSDFSGNDTLTIDDLCLQNFTANSPADNMELYVEGPADVTVDAFDDKFIAIGQMVFVGGSACFADGVAGNMSNFTPFTIGGENNRILVVGVSVYDSTASADADVTDVQFNGVSMTPGPEITASAGTHMRTEIWYMLEANLPVAGMYDFDVTTAGVTDERFLSATYIYNAKQTGMIPEAIATGSQAVSMSPFSTAITTMNDGAWIFDAIGTGVVTMNTPDAVAPQTEVCDSQLAAASAATSYKDLATAGMTTMSWSGFTTGAPMSHAVAAFAPFVVNQPPVLTMVVPMVTFGENLVNMTPQIIDADVTLTDIDSPDFDGGNLTVNYSVGGGAEDQLAFDTTGDFTLVGTSVRYMGVEIGTVPAAGPGSGINGASLIISFDPDATLAIVELLIEALTYGNTSDTPTASRTIQITVDDGDGGVSAPTSTIINVTAENDPPTLTMVNTLMSAQEDTPYTITYAALLAASNANDPDGDTLMFRVFSVTTGTLTKNGTPVVPGFTMLAVGETLVWTPPMDENNVTESGPHDAFTVTVNDGVLNSAPDVTVPINVLPCNDPPSFLRGGDRTETAGVAHTTSPWASSISPGPADESGQTVGFVLTTDNNALFSVLPTVNAAGDISFTIAPAASGFARVSIVAVDSGSNGGCDVNTSAAQTFVISTSVHFRRCGPIIATAGGPADLILLDVGGNDGKRDFIVADMTAGSLGIWLGNGNSTFTQLGTFPLVAGAMPVALTMNDFNRDGKDDFAVANFGNNDITVFRGSIGSPVIRLTGTIAVGTAPMDIITGDFNGDSRADIVTANNGSANISLLVNQGNMVFAAAANTAVGAGPSGVTAGDYNGDSNLDLAVSNFTDDTVTILLGDGVGNFAPAAGSPIAVGNEPIAIEGARDLNGDGRLDLAVCNFNGGLAGGTISLLLGNGAGGFAAAAGSPIAVDDGPRAINLRDIDVDGDFDMVVMNNGVARDSATLMFNNGSGGFAMTESMYTGTDPVGLVIGNLNGPNNGNDMAICNFTDGTVQVLCYVAPRALPFPNSTDRSLDVLEDSMVTFEAIGEVLTQEPLTFTLVTPPVNGMLTGVIPNPTYTPDPDYFGTDTFTFRVTSTTSGLSSANATVKIWIQAVNDEPSMTIATPSSSAASGAGPQVIANFATALSKGPLNESGQKLQIQHSPHQSYNRDLFLVQPTIDVTGTTGTLRYTPRPGQSGATSIKFRIVDNQGIGTNFGGDPIGNEVTVTFTITP